MPWFDVYRAYDDDTLTTLANAGLLRRAAKDVEAGKLAWLELREDGGALSADGQRVELDTRGPGQARCDCPAAGLCKHILGAVLWLRAQAPSPSAAPENATPDCAAEDRQAEAPGSGPSPLEEILALTPDALFKAAGIAAVRRAAATPVEHLVWHDQGAVLVLELPELGAVCRWIAGTGFAGMVSEVPAAERRTVHLIALAALRRELGSALEWPDGVAPARAQESSAASEDELRFLDQIDALLRELITGGLAHVSELTSARLFALNISARGKGLPRLAAHLRKLGGMVDLLAQRDHRVEERDVLALMARIHALCWASRTARGEQATALRGQLRRTFDETAALDLLALGAHWWQTRGGARGLTLAFWDIPAARLLQATLARPDASDASFTRLGAWKTNALWQGAGPAQQICEGALRLEQPRQAEDGRLALGSVTRAQTLPAWSCDDERIATLGYRDWTELAAQLRDMTGLSGTVIDAALLRPSAMRAPRLDEVRQRFDWAVQDERERWLVLSIPCGPEHRERIANLDRLIARGAVVRAVLVHIERSAYETILMPVSVLVDSETGKTLQAVSLDFATEPARSTPLAGRILRLFEARSEAPPGLAAPTLAARLFAPVLEVIETQAETGRLALTAAQAGALQQAHARIASVGLATPADALLAHLNHATSDSLLRLSWLCQLLAVSESLPLPE
ncbi:SWIM zinc finger family protein [Niveibacterium terrae]|uniref:SWIM zinc finger family protein n=1 Tax=Niveibacterium terrae TaxID=3373598 RepID=UPI003A8D04DB